MPLDPWTNVALLSDYELSALGDDDAREDPFWSAPEYGGTHGGVMDPVAGGEDAEDLVEKHDVAFLVLDGNGDPYGGLDYRLEGPDGDEEGTLGDSAEIEKSDVTSEDYCLTLREVVAVSWGAPSAEADIEVTIEALLHGYADGTAAEVRLFRLYAEQDDDVLETLDATVTADKASVSWTYAHDPDGPFAKDQGVVYIVAEVRVGAEGPWAKTLEPLALQLPTVDEARWSDDEVEPGEEVELTLTADGVPDGTPITVEVFQCRRSGEELLLESFEETIEAGTLSLRWAFPESDDPDAPPIDAECFFIATLDGDPNRITVSDTLTVGYDELTAA